MRARAKGGPRVRGATAVRGCGRGRSRAAEAALASACLVGLAAVGCERVSALQSAFARAPEPAVAAAPPPAPGAIASLGRLQPRDGVVRIAGPAMVAVVRRLDVDRGDRVKRGQVIALLDETEIREAAVARSRARVSNARAELLRFRELHRGHVVSDSQRDELKLALQVAEAELQQDLAELERSKVRSPIDGRVLEVHARAGERVGADGIVELGRTDEMYAVAEVYETDIGRVREGQRASVRSPALPRPLHGKVDRIGVLVGKLDALGTDPAARTDARVVEVEIRLDDDDVVAASSLTHLQVEIEIEP